MSLPFLKDAVDEGDTEKLIRYVRLHFGDGNEAVGRKEIDKAWIEALKLLLDVPPTDREFIFETLKSKDASTLAHLFFICIFILSNALENGYTMANSSEKDSQHLMFPVITHARTSSI